MERNILNGGNKGECQEIKGSVAEIGVAEGNGGSNENVKCKEPLLVKESQLESDTKKGNNMKE